MNTKALNLAEFRIVLCRVMRLANVDKQTALRMMNARGYSLVCEVQS
jgi:hypothetical protein